MMVMTCHSVPQASKRCSAVVSSRLSSSSPPPTPIPPSTTPLRAPVCFCFVLESSRSDSQGWSWPRTGEMSRSAGKLPRSSRPLFRALTVLAFRLCRHHATSPCFSSIFRLSSSTSVFTRGGGWTCVSGDWQQRWWGAVVRRALKFQLWPAVRREQRTWKHRVTFQHRAMWPGGVLVCVLMNILYLYGIYEYITL